MDIKKSFPLKSYNTFGINIKTKYFVELSSDAIKSFLSHDILNDNSLLILGGGSNILFTKDYEGIVLKINSKGIKIVDEDNNNIYIKANAGENWNDFVNYCLDKNYAGLENLSLIPGNVGTSPIQNIGAYGVELKDVFYELEAIHIKSGTLKTFSKEDCRFGYRDSIFKNELKNQYIILSVTFKLNKKPQFNTKYGDIENELKEISINELNIQVISEAVCKIRKKKLPDPVEIGNAGSFFKNPIISNTKYHELKNSFPSIIAYEQKNKSYKLAAGWLIEQCGWKGKRIKDAGVHYAQALILVNHGDATGMEIYNLSNDIKKSVCDKFGITLETEVNII